MSRRYEILLAGLLLVAPMHGEPPANKCFARVDAQGSLPPLPQLYGCVRELTGKAYDAAAAKSCLDTILASGYFESGRLEAESGSSNVIVHFVLTAPSLTIRDVNFDVEDDLKEAMLAWIEKTGDILSAGDVYRGDRDEKTTEVLGFYFRNIGKNVGITRIANLDYRARTAELTYRITVGPDTIPVRALPPYEPECEQSVSMFNGMDVDDYVPVNLVEKMTQTHAFGCFSAAAVSRDSKALRDSKLFNKVRYDVQGEPDNIEVSLHVQGKPLKVKEVRIVGYGLLSHRVFTDSSALALQPGDPYRRSLMDLSKDYLKNKYAEPGEIVDVTEDDQLADDDELIVTFNVLAYEQDTVTINGKDFRVAPVVINVHS
jgi:hypothetical protein